ncbi:cell division protein ZapA [Desulfitobacterium metallireducens]|uniref:Cell division protein ZapA n=1 Tax=Desulfitobacterium metallireducens DSM 15288 TaxID=871968 RepID=W0E984_9FIRM|nr:cell division protein ZapA [Desulfitobacterium metallireducens]AHF05769.1 cell division protein ZapA [Desulfitobacterium metallireducens DSM 15288]
MSKEDGKVTVEIFGEKHVLRGTEDLEYIQKLAYKVDKKMRLTAQRFPRLAAHRIAILVALNLEDDLEKLREEQETLMEMLGEQSE